MWAYTTGDAVGPNMMTRNSYALNMGYVMEHAPVKPQRAILEANMGGDKKPSHRYFERGGHGKTVIAETTLTHEDITAHIQATMQTIYHPVGTCKMGTDDMAVVDPQLRVRGVEGLRVVEKGLKPDEKVILTGLQQIRPGAKITPTEGDMKAFAGGTERPRVRPSKVSDASEKCSSDASPKRR